MDWTGIAAAILLSVFLHSAIHGPQKIFARSCIGCLFSVFLLGQAGVESKTITYPLVIAGIGFGLIMLGYRLKWHFFGKSK